jgi:hypothetical protein
MSSPSSGSKNKTSKNPGWKQVASSFACHIWRRHVPLKRRLTFNGVQGVMSQKIELFYFTNVHLNIVPTSKVNKLAEEITLLTCIREVLGSILGPEFRLSRPRIFVVFLSPSRTASFYILSNLLFTISQSFDTVQSELLIASWNKLNIYFHRLLWLLNGRLISVCVFLALLIRATCTAHRTPLHYLFCDEHNCVPRQI